MKKSLTVLAVVLAFGAEAFANNYFIPNYHKSRRAMNQYSALGWSERHEVSAEVAMNEGDTKEDGTKTEETKGTDIRALVFHRLPNNLNLEAMILTGKEEVKDKPSDDKTDNDTLELNLGAGYQLNNMSFGASIQRETLKEKPDGGTSTDESDDTLRLGWGMMLENNWFVGLGYQNNLNTPDSGASNTVHTYLVGGGKVWGDLKKADAAVEAYFATVNQDGYKINGLTAQGLLNHDERTQFTGALSYGQQEDDTSKATVIAISPGMDIEFAEMFYVAPQITWINVTTDIDGANGNVKADSLGWSLEGGYRKDKIDFFVRYNSSNSKTDFPSSFTDEDSKTRLGTVALGGSYFF